MSYFLIFYLIKHILIINLVMNCDYVRYRTDSISEKAEPCKESGRYMSFLSQRRNKISHLDLQH